MSVTVTPRATYRVQLHAGFDLDAAAGLVEYLDELGGSHLYTSPSLQATAGSTHGYDERGIDVADGGVCLPPASVVVLGPPSGSHRAEPGRQRA